ncbi:hypothetical protein MHYP_G00312640 [Metynnis hypsauchen]
MDSEEQVEEPLPSIVRAHQGPEKVWASRLILGSLKGCPVILDKLESPSRQTGFRALKPHSTIFRLVETCLTGQNTSGELNVVLRGSIGGSGRRLVSRSSLGTLPSGSIGDRISSS